ncbi:MAG: hypothetical protein M0007_01020 [Actinomycetota bacterium]|nr:hypothetical protein [Actinomycetota bacterium]
MPGVPEAPAPAPAERGVLRPGRERGWRVDLRTAAAGRLHASWPAVDADPGRPAVAVCHPADTAVVLGSTQPEAAVDRVQAARRGVSVVRRRSGGGAVWVAPGAQVWVDLWVPAGHARWDADVVRSFEWVGELWSGALAAAGVTGARWHRGKGTGGPWAATVCFGGVGSGEVVAADGRKVVGLSQRRTRAGAWFTGAAYRVWDPQPLAGVLALDPAERARMVSELGPAAVGVGQLLDSPSARGVQDPLAALADLVTARLTL